MRKFIFMMLMLFVAFAFTSCESCDNDTDGTPSIEWNLTVSAAGEGHLVVSYPTGNLELNGAASLIAKTSNDTVKALLEAGYPEYREVLANPDGYKPEQVNLAKEIQSAFNVDTMEGKWQVDITGYAKYSSIYIVIDEHWPATPTDSIPEGDTIPILGPVKSQGEF